MRKFLVTTLVLLFAMMAVVGCRAEGEVDTSSHIGALR
jgi:hypothetical protein